jgi:hypothetical protein
MVRRNESAAPENNAKCEAAIRGTPHRTGQRGRRNPARRRNVEISSHQIDFKLF